MGSTRPGSVAAKVRGSLATVTVWTGKALWAADGGASASPQPASATAAARQLAIPIARKLLMIHPSFKWKNGPNDMSEDKMSQFCLI
jgi:hypothetical protein